MCTTTASSTRRSWPRSSRGPPPPRPKLLHRESTIRNLSGSAIFRGRRPVKSILDVYHCVFAAAFTFLASSLNDGSDRQGLGKEDFLPVGKFLLAGTTVMFYWTKTVRLLGLVDCLTLPQQVIVTVWMLTIVVLPKFTADSFDYHDTRGTVWDWNSGATVHLILLSLYTTLDLSCLVFTCLLHRDQTNVQLPKHVSLSRLVTIHLCVPIILVFLLLLQLFFAQVSDQYTFLVPLCLVVEEIILFRVLHVPVQLLASTARKASRWLSISEIASGSRINEEEGPNV